MPHAPYQTLAGCLAALALATTAAAAGSSRGFGDSRPTTGVRGFNEAGSAARAGKSKATDKSRHWANEYLKDNDRNKDGVLTVAETKRWSKFVPFDHDNNKRISVDELVAYSTGVPLKKKRSSLPAGSDKDKDGRRSQRLWTATDKLPEGLPSWFKDKDGNRDGQVAMHEYSRTWSASTVRRFLGLDKNDDGLITPDEALDKR